MFSLYIEFQMFFSKNVQTFKWAISKTLFPSLTGKTSKLYPKFFLEMVFYVPLWQWFSTWLTHYCNLERYQKALMSGPHPKPIKLESLGVEHRYWHILKAPLMIQTHNFQTLSISKSTISRWWPLLFKTYNDLFRGFIYSHQWAAKLPQSGIGIDVEESTELHRFSFSSNVQSAWSHHSCS